MNKNYERIVKNNTDIVKRLNECIPGEIKYLDKLPLGDVPEAKTSIHPAQVECARTVFQKLKEIIPEYVGESPYSRIVISVYGGAGVGKTGMAALLREYFRQAGILVYSLSGDNYPRRLPKYNDAERLSLFRQAGLCGLIENDEYTLERFKILKKLQLMDQDANEQLIYKYPWLETYLTAGKKRLEKYLGGPEEQEFEVINQIIKAFKDGASKIWLKKMGREESELWYEQVDFSDISILLIEWTHGNSRYLEDIDIPIYLNSTPAETLEYRKQRNRDKNSDSPFIMQVLSIEQNILYGQADKAKIIFLKEGRIVSYEEFLKIQRR